MVARLVVFPAVSVALSILLLITFAVPAVMGGLFDSPPLAGSRLPVAAHVLGFLFSVVQSQRASVCLVEAREGRRSRHRRGQPRPWHTLLWGVWSDSRLEPGSSRRLSPIGSGPLRKLRGIA